MKVWVKECCVQVSFFFFLTVCLALILDKTNTAVLALCAAGIHELGHLLCMLAFGERPACVRIAPFGFCITRTPRGSYRQEILIALAGPAANLLAALALFLTAKVCKTSSLNRAILVNLSLALFNLIPIEPLDCGRAVLCRLCCRTDSARAERIVFLVGLFFLVPLTVCGVLVLIKSKYNVTLLLAGAYLTYTLLKKR